MKIKNRINMIMMTIVAFLLIIIILFFILAFVIFNLGFEYRYPLNNLHKVDGVWSLSRKGKNLVIIMNDMMGGIEVASILTNPQNASIINNLTGFTNYQNLITTHTGTNGSIPNLFGGFDFNVYNKQNHPQFKNLTLRQYMRKSLAVLTSGFGNAGWDINWISPPYYHYNPEQKSYWFSNWKTLEQDFATYQVKALNPPDISHWLFQKHPQLYQALNLPAKIWQKDTNINDIGMVGALSRMKIIDSNVNKLLNISSQAVHTKLVMNQKGHYEANLNDDALSAYYAHEGFLYHFDKFITHLKTNQVYDNTMIILVSDHGGGLPSLPVLDYHTYNFQPYINYEPIRHQWTKYSAFTRHFPTLLIKPFNAQHKLIHNTDDLYTNTDLLTFIQEYIPEVHFPKLNTKHPHFLKRISDVKSRNSYLVSYGNDSLWQDHLTKYLKPQGQYAGHSFIVKNNIFDLNNYRWAQDDQNYYDVEDLNKWVSQPHYF